jgi:subtilase family serine protease
MRGIQSGPAIALALAISWANSTVAFATAGRQTLSGHVPAFVQTMQPVGTLDGTNRVKLAIALPLRNTEALTNLLRQLYDPSSPQYRQWLTSDQFLAQFGPTDADYQAVLAFAQAHNFTVTAQHSNRRLVDVTAAAADINAAFNITLQMYHHPTEARDFFATATEPSVDAGVPILDISGLSNFGRPKPNYHVHRNVGPVRQGDSKLGGPFVGTDYRSAYAPGVTLDGTGQSVGLLEFDGYHTNDITTYASSGFANISPMPAIQKILLDGFDGTATTGANSANGEVALDIEVTMSMAPKLTKIVVFEADPVNGLPNDILNAMSTNTTIKQFSSSWSWPVSLAPQTSMDAYFMTMNAQGQGFFNASGDGNANPAITDEPQDDPFVTLVGGTVLATTGPTGGSWLYENVWNVFPTSGTGGGISGNSYSIPSWQSPINMSTNGGSPSLRNSPDVAAIADNVFIVADNGQAEITGGTSCGAPLWAAFSAMANQQAVANGQPVIGFINPAIYALTAGPGYAACFDDIIGGNNDNGAGTSFPAVTGYDLCTGLGTMTGSSLINALATPDGFYITAGRGFVANGPVGGPFNITTQTLTLTNGGASSFTWQVSAAPSWLNVSLSSGSFSLSPGGPAANLTVSLTPAAVKMVPGVYTANLRFSKVSGGPAQFRQFTLMVGQELAQDGGFEAGDFAYWPLAGANAFDGATFVDFANDAPPNGAGLPVHSGTYFAALGAAGTPLATMSQTIPTLAGQLYIVKYWLYSDGQSPNEFQASWNGSVLFDSMNMGAFGYTQFRFVVAGAPANSVLTFGFQNDAGWLGLDDVSVQALPLPAFLSVGVTNHIVSFNWAALSGEGYQLQYKTNLTSGTWNNIGSPITAAGANVITTDPNPPDPTRFYRVQLIPH